MKHRAIAAPLTADSPVTIKNQSILFVFKMTIW